MSLRERKQTQKPFSKGKIKSDIQKLPRCNNMYSYICIHFNKL